MSTHNGLMVANGEGSHHAQPVNTLRRWRGRWTSNTPNAIMINKIKVLSMKPTVMT